MDTTQQDLALYNLSCGLMDPTSCVRKTNSAILHNESSSSIGTSSDLDVGARLSNSELFGDVSEHSVVATEMDMPVSVKEKDSNTKQKENCSTKLQKSAEGRPRVVITKPGESYSGPGLGLDSNPETRTKPEEKCGTEDSDTSSSSQSDDTLVKDLIQSVEKFDLVAPNLGPNANKEEKLLDLRDRRRRHRTLSNESVRNRSGDSDSIWHRVVHGNSSSSSISKSGEGVWKDGGYVPPLQSKPWSSKEKETISRLLALLPPSNDEEKEQERKVKNRMKNSHRNWYDVQAYFSLLSRNPDYPEILEDAEVEEVLIEVEDLAPGYQAGSPAFQRLMDQVDIRNAVSGSEEDETEEGSQPKEIPKKRKKGGNSGRKHEKDRLNSALNGPQPLPPPSGANREKQAKEEEPHQQPELVVKKEVDAFDEFLAKCDRQELPKMMKFKDHLKNVVIATLDECNEGPTSDHTVKDQKYIYRLEPYVDKDGKLIPWHDLDKTFPDRPFCINAAQLVDIAGRKWAGRLDIEQKRSLVSCGFENAYKMPFLDKLNLSREYAIRILDVVLGDRTTGVAYMPEAIVTVDSTFEGDPKVPHAKLFVKPGYERTVRAYSLLNLFVPHFIFPITARELNKGIEKRTGNRFNYASFKRNKAKILAVAETFKFAKGCLPEVAPGDFKSFALEMVTRKGLSEGESLPFYASAEYAEFLMEEDGSGTRLLKMLSYFLEKETKVFIKDEEYSKTKTAVRFIVSPHVFVKVVFGTVFRRVEEMLYFDERSPMKKHLIKGMSSLEVKEKLISLPIREGEVYAETDYESFESSQVKETLKIEYDIYASFYKEQTLARRIIQLVGFINCAPGWLFNRWFRILREAMRLSGLNPTACGNALWNIINLVACCGVDIDSLFLVEGDDGMLVVPVDVAQTMCENSLFPMTLILSKNWSDLSFCGHHYTAEGTKIIDREELLRKITTYFSPNPISRRKAYELLYLRLLSFQISYAGNPYLDEFIDETNREYADVRKRGVREKTIKQWYKQNWWRFDEHIREVKLPGDRSEVPNFHKTFARLLEKSNQRGEVLTGEKQVSILNYSLSRQSHSHASFLSNAALEVLWACTRAVRSFSGTTSLSKENCIEMRNCSVGGISNREATRRSKHDHLVESLNQFSWYRSLARRTGWRFLQHCDEGLIGPKPSYSNRSSFEVVSLTSAFNSEWVRLQKVDEIVSSPRYGVGRSYEALLA